MRKFIYIILFAICILSFPHAEDSISDNSDSYTEPVQISDYESTISMYRFLFILSTVGMFASIGVFIIMGLKNIRLNQNFANIRNKFIAKEVDIYSELIDFELSQKKLEALDKKSKNIFNSISIGILIIEKTNFQIRDVNKRACDIWGYSKEEFLTLNIENLSLESYKNKNKDIKQIIKRIFYSESQSLDWLVRGKSGTAFWVNVTFKLTEFQEKDVIIATVVNIAKRKEAELKLSMSNQYQKVLILIHQLLLHDSKYSGYNNDILKHIGQITQSNRIIIFEKNEKTNTTFRNLSEWNSDMEFVKDIKEIELSTDWQDELFKGEPIQLGSMDIEIFKENKRYNYLNDCKSVFLVPFFFNNDLIGILGLFTISYERHWNEYEQDFLTSTCSAITAYIEKQRMSQDIIEREERFRTLTNNQQSGIFILYEDTVLFANKTLYTQTGISPDELKHGFIKYLPKGVELKFRSWYRDMINNKRVQSRFNVQVNIPNKDISWIDFSGTRIRYEGKDALLCTVIDITESKKRAKRLKLAQFSINNSDDTIIWFKTNGQIFFANRKAHTTLGYESDSLRNVHMSQIDEFYGKNVWKTMWNELQRISPLIFESQHIKKSGERLPVETSIEIGKFNDKVYAFTTSRNIQKRKDAEKEKDDLREKLQNSDRMEALGNMAGGIAHDINNPLMGIINFGQLIKDNGDREKIDSFADVIIEEGKRVAVLVGKLLDYSRPAAELFDYYWLDNIFSDCLTLTNSLFRKSNIKIINNIEKNKYLLFCNKSRIQQIFIDTMENAKYSLNKKYPTFHKNKKIQVSAEEFMSEKGKYVRIDIKDWGLGISQSIAKNIFDPYFTTKSRTEGSGLGLSQTHNTVKEHQGLIIADSIEGEYARIIIELPFKPNVIEGAGFDDD